MLIIINYYLLFLLLFYPSTLRNLELILRCNELGEYPENLKFLSEGLKNLPNNLNKLELNLNRNELGFEPEEFIYLSESIKKLPNNLHNLLLDLSEN